MAGVKSELADIGEEMRDLTLQQRDLEAQTEHTATAFSRVQVAVGVTAGIVGTAVFAIGQVNTKIRELSGLAATTGTDIGRLEMKTRRLAVLLGDGDFAAEAVRGIEELNFAARSLDLSSVPSAALAGLDIQKLLQGNLTLQDIRDTLDDINRTGTLRLRR